MGANRESPPHHTSIDSFSSQLVVTLMSIDPPLHAKWLHTSARSINPSTHPYLVVEENAGGQRDEPEEHLRCHVGKHARNPRCVCQCVYVCRIDVWIGAFSPDTSEPIPQTPCHLPSERRTSKSTTKHAHTALKPLLQAPGLVLLPCLVPKLHKPPLPLLPLFLLLLPRRPPPRG